MTVKDKTSPLYVVKVGSATLEHEGIFGELSELVARGARVLLVAGGAAGIERHYREIGKPVRTLTLANGDAVRYCPPSEMPSLVSAYEHVTLPMVEAGLAAHGRSVFAATASRGGLVSGRLNRPLKVVEKGRPRLVRDHRAGTPSDMDVARLGVLLDAYDVVCVSPPVAGEDGLGPVNVDADVLAAALANALRADHLRLVTGTAGLLRDVADPASTLTDLHEGEGASFAGGRMRQKVRAAELALSGGADVAVTGPHTMADRSGWTRFWPAREPAPDLALLSRAAAIPSVSRDEGELASYLAGWCAERGIEAGVDEAGNLVATKGAGPRTLMLLGHLDTVPHHWPVSWDGEELSGRGTVDAKGCLAAFLEVLAGAEVPADGRLRVVGAVEEEVSSSKGGFHARDNYPADAVVIGEPSGSGTLTLGYFGLFKLRVTVRVPSGHSASKSFISAPDALIGALAGIRADVLAKAPEALSAVIDLRVEPGRGGDTATGVLNFRVPPGVDPVDLTAVALAHRAPDVDITVERATPGHAGGRTSSLVKSFTAAFGRAGIRPRFVVKKGTSDMNTLATTWRGVPMVAYGPGDSALDHTEHERVGAGEYRSSRAVLADAVAGWFERTGGAL
ncbi:bifunctional protein: acetyl-glutamate kinase; acetyl-ornithine deacetylase [Actinorhabdospora filicis]|uniref:Bifunctional protein: acetyl-glutamate kinase acetyl-ornithine deacetylase n=1 Tax=Actinorhabdospora filicis TaxID=1785913 RepID=A0A9W6SMH3_9ACTN|nr:M20/M25/M40 family metallo-hydrolase [Actinorhabdospora filicis]GLZ79645.1 bifunctional protein: acetyl-glutamate kinase; acetyl-ornithine deacetylase [Actinorhabdospora filicis]